MQVVNPKHIHRYQKYAIASCRNLTAPAVSRKKRLVSCRVYKRPEPSQSTPISAYSVARPLRGNSGTSGPRMTGTSCPCSYHRSHLLFPATTKNVLYFQNSKFFQKIPNFLKKIQIKIQNLKFFFCLIQVILFTIIQLI